MHYKVEESIKTGVKCFKKAIFKSSIVMRFTFMSYQKYKGQGFQLMENLTVSEKDVLSATAVFSTGVSLVFTETVQTLSAWSIQSRLEVAFHQSPHGRLIKLLLRSQ